MRDDDFLYIVVKVIDNDISDADNVHLYLSLDNDRTSNCPWYFPKAYKNGTFNLISSNANSEDGNARTTQDENELRFNPIEEYAKSITEDGYIVEFKFNLKTGSLFLDDFKSVASTIIGFDIGVHQANTGDTLARSQAIWSNDGTNRNWTESTNFGTALFSDFNCIGVNKISSLVGSVSLSPNPASDNVRLLIEAKQEDKVTISLINSLSQKVYNAESQLC